MDSRSNTESLAIRFAPYITELREFFTDRGLRFGSRSDLDPLSRKLAKPGSFQDEMMSMLRAIVFRERGVVPRNELLDLILLAISGVGVDRIAGQDRRADHAQAVHAVDEFVSKVIQSLKRKTFEDEGDEEEGDGEEADESTTSLPAVIPSASPARSEQPAIERHAAPPPTPAWNFNPILEQRSMPYPRAGVFARAQTISPPLDESSWQHKPSPASQPPPRPVSAAKEIMVVRAVPVVPVVPVIQPRSHFFRNTMGVLVVGLAAALFWRYEQPLETASQPGEPSETVVAPDLPTSPAGAASAPATPASSPGLAGSIWVGADRDPAVNAAAFEARRQAGLEPTMSMLMAQPSEPLPPRPAPVSTPVAAPPVPAAPAATPTPALAGNLPPTSRRRPPPRPAAIPVAPVAARQAGFLVSSGVMDNNLIAADAPKYPMMASMAGVEGRVILQAVVSRNGTVLSTPRAGRASPAAWCRDEGGPKLALPAVGHPRKSYRRRHGRDRRFPPSALVAPVPGRSKDHEPYAGWFNEA